MFGNLVITVLLTQMLLRVMVSHILFENRKPVINIRRVDVTTKLGTFTKVSGAGPLYNNFVDSRYSLDYNFGIPGTFGHGNGLATCKYFAMQPQLCGRGLEALQTYFLMS